MLYLYALLDAPFDGRAEGLCIVACDPVWAAVDEVEAAPVASVAALQRHDALVRGLTARVDAVAPARFGVVASGHAELAERVAQRRTEVRALLGLVARRAQMSVRVFDTIAAVQPEALDPPPDAGGGPGARYLLERARRVRERSTPVERLREALGDVVVAERVEHRPGERLVASMYHLVERGDADRYRAVLEDARVPGTLVVNGPAPCYAFADSLKL